MELIILCKNGSDFSTICVRFGFDCFKSIKYRFFSNILHIEIIKSIQYSENSSYYKIAEIRIAGYSAD